MKNSFPTASNLGLHASKRWSFHFSDREHAIKWTAPLQQMRCFHRNGTGKRCKRQITYTLPFCWQHLKAAYGIRLGRTQLRDKEGKRLDFLGLFACDPIKKGERICPYVGQRITHTQKDERYGDKTAPYALEVNSKLVYDAATVRGVGSLANTTVGRRDVRLRNCKIVGGRQQRHQTR